VNLSIIIPSFNEGENLVNITRRIQAALAPLSIQYEIIFIDDSSDNTPALLAELARAHECVRYKHRTHERGLGTAVVAGFALAQGESFIVMDADLQHPPEILPDMIEALKTNDLVIPSRFIPGGSDGGLNFFRKWISLIARKIGQFALKRFRTISDCTSGCFGLHRDVIKDIKLNPNSWKILMEILVKGRYQTIQEIPYHFMARDLGNSKMSVKEQWHYLMHIAKLVAISPDDRRFYLFCLVGGLGVLVNLIFFHLFLWSGIHVLLSSILGSSVALMHNFCWHHYVTWKDCRPTTRKKKVMQLPQFVSISLVGILMTVMMVKVFVDLDFSASMGQLVGIGVATGWNYLANKAWTWRV
jgi:dolichol-phosphate mannosyltransferase